MVVAAKRQRPRYTTRQVAEILGISLDYVRKKARRGLLPHTLTPTGRYLFDPEFFEEDHEPKHPSCPNVVET